METQFVGYEKERQVFRAFLQPDSEKRILLLHGFSGSGKTALIEACLADLSEDMIYVPIQLRGNTVGITEIFDRVGEHIGWKRMPNFVEQVALLLGVPIIQVKRNWQVGSNNQINIALHNEDDPMIREFHRLSLTKAWFADLMALAHPLLLIFDTYEQAPTDVCSWLEGPMLARAVLVKRLRVLLAGQTVPKKDNIEWGNCCAFLELYGVPEARKWMPFLNSMRRIPPSLDPLSWLAGVCHALKGNPDKIRQIIEGLPEEQTA